MQRRRVTRGGRAGERVSRQRRTVRSVREEEKRKCGEPLGGYCALELLGVAVHP